KPLFPEGWSKNVPYYFDQDGNPWVRSIPGKTLFGYVFSALLVGAVFILSRLGMSYFWGKQFQKFRARLDPLANIHSRDGFGELMGGPDFGPLIAEAARRRLVMKVAKEVDPKDVRSVGLEKAEDDGETILVANGYAELGFLANLIPFYAYLMN